MTSTTDQAAVVARDLIAPELFDRLAAGIARDHGLPGPLAERIMEQALAFLYACTITNAKLSPSPQVDLGWHAFVLHTQEYADFCERVNGAFIHHVPDAAESVGRAEALERLGATMATIRAAGLTVDAELWTLPAECSQCYQGCADDPAPIGDR